MSYLINFEDIPRKKITVYKGYFSSPYNTFPKSFEVGHEIEEGNTRIIFYGLGNPFTEDEKERILKQFNIIINGPLPSITE